MLNHLLNHFRCFSMLFSLMVFFYIFPIHAIPKQKDKLFHHQTSQVHFYFTQDREAQLERLIPVVQMGIHRLQTAFQQTGLPVKPAFWIFGNSTEMKVALKRHTKLSYSQISRVVRTRVYKSKRNIMILFPMGADSNDISRLILQEYATRLIRIESKHWQTAQNGWFQLGMATYLAWYVNGETVGDPVTLIHQNMIRYYSAYLDPDHVIPLDSLETAQEWQQALKMAPAQVYAQSVISYMYLSARMRPYAGISLLKRVHAARDFPFEFERMVGLHLHDFEKELMKRIFPEIRKWRKDNKQKIPKRKTLPITFSETKMKQFLAVH